MEGVPDLPVAPQDEAGLTRMETRRPWRPTRGSLTSPSYLVRNRTLGPPLENNPEIPPSSRELETEVATEKAKPRMAEIPGLDAIVI